MEPRPRASTLDAKCGGMLSLLALLLLGLAATTTGVERTGAGARSHTARAQGFVQAWLAAVEAGRELPIAVQLCNLVPAGPPTPPGRTHCSMAGKWRYQRTGDLYAITEDPAAGTFAITSDYPGDPWRSATGRILTRNASTPPRPRRCAGGMVLPKPRPAGAYDVVINFDCAKSVPPSTYTLHGSFGADCRTLAMQDGWLYTRIDATIRRPVDGDADGDAANCSVVALTKQPSPSPAPSPAGRAVPQLPGTKPGWRGTNLVYTLDTRLRFDVLLQTDPTSTVARLNATVTALEPLGACLGGVSILRLTLPDQPGATTTLHGSTGGPATGHGQAALQPWRCTIGAGAGNNSCNNVDGTPFRPHEDVATATLAASVDGRTPPPFYNAKMRREVHFARVSGARTRAAP